MTSLIIDRLSIGLDSIDKFHVVELVDKFGLYGSARIMGYDVSHYNNLLMAGRLAIENLKNNSPKKLIEYAALMKHRLNTPTYDFIVNNQEKLQKAIEKNEFNDYDHDWFSANTMITMYSANTQHGSDGIETPQYIWMRIAIQLYHSENNAINRVIEAYEEMSKGLYTPASPTIFNAGMKEPQMASCFLLTIGDNLESILKTGIYRGGMISKASGGLGFDVSRVRHSEIKETGWSNGIVPMLQLYNSMVRYVDQGGRRKGAATIYLRPHHIDIEDFIELPRKVGDKYARAHDLNICIWTSWIFWDRLKNDGNWTLFCPARVPQLNDIYGEEFTKAYIEAENDPTIKSKHKKVIRVRDLWDKIIDIQKETGMPYLMNGDASNLKSNHRHNGYIRSSNLCLEVIEYTDDDTIAVCNLHSLSLRMYAKSPIDRNIKNIGEALNQSVDFELLANMSRKVIQNLNKVIDHNWYPLDRVVDGNVKPKIINKSNKKHRPVGMGVSGFAELLHILDLPFEDPIVLILNKMLFACMYWNALAQSIQLAILNGPYETFKGSPTSEGKLQFDLWKEEFNILGPNMARQKEDDEPINPKSWEQKSFKLYDENNNIMDTIENSWDDIKRCMVKYGLYNSLLIALMPTATTAQIRRNCESVEAHQNNMYSRKVLKCSYPVLNRYMIEDLEKLGLWNNSVVEYLKVKNGSILGLSSYIANNKNLFQKFNGDNMRMKFLEDKYKTMWEIPQKTFMKLAADRGRYIDQSSSTNVYIRDGSDSKLKACHLYANMLGLKTIMYYLRQTGGESIKFTADPRMIKHIKGLNVDSDNEDNNKKIVCTDEVCTSCT
jgi:ribonucleoside-diphosphate reductase alpha subunit